MEERERDCVKPKKTEESDCHSGSKDHANCSCTTTSAGIANRIAFSALSQGQSLRRAITLGMSVRGAGRVYQYAGWATEGSWFDVRQGQDFFRFLKHPNRFCGPLRLSVRVLGALPAWIKRPGRTVDHLSLAATGEMD